MTVAERIAYFSKLWKQATLVFPYFDRISLDFDTAYSDYIPRVLSAENDRDFCLILSEFINLLGDGHTDFTIPMPLREQEGFLPFYLAYMDRDYYLISVPNGQERHRWAKVISVNGEPWDALLTRAFRYIYHVGSYAYPSKLHAILPFLLRQTGNEMETSAGIFRFDLVKNRPDPVTTAGVDADIPFRNLQYGTTAMRLYEGNILSVDLPDLMSGGAAASIAAAIAELGDIRGIILDLRENVGGMTANGAKIAELFIAGQFHGCCKRTRMMKGIDISSASQYARMSEETIEQYITDGLCDREEVERCRKINSNTLFEEYRDTFGAPDHSAIYTGPCVILTTRNTISAAEDLVAMFRSNRRATVIGTPTHGSTGTPLLLPLSVGGGARICSVGYRLLDGTEFIGSGIVPDIAAEQDIDSLRMGRDPVMKRALEFLQG